MVAFALTILKPIHILNTNQPKRKLAYRSRPCFYRLELELELELHIKEHLSDVMAAKNIERKIFSMNSDIYYIIIRYW